MTVTKQTTPGPLPYLSIGKLHACASQLGIDTASLGPESTTSTSAGASLSIPLAGKASLQRSRQHSRVDAAWREQAEQRLLSTVLKRLGELPDIERSEAAQEGDWVRFHRNVMLGVAHADCDPSLKALVVVDAKQPEVAVPRLLLNGSVVHVRDPYASDELRASAGSRSGSGTDEWFAWLEQRRRPGKTTRASRPASCGNVATGRPATPRPHSTCTTCSWTVGSVAA